MCVDISKGRFTLRWRSALAVKNFCPRHGLGWCAGEEERAIKKSFKKS